MNKVLLGSILSFVAGGGTGVLVTHILYKKKFDKKVDEEVASCRAAIEEAYKRKPVDHGKSNESDNKDPEQDQEIRETLKRAHDKGDLFAYARELAEKRESINYSAISTGKEYKTETEEIPDDVLITPEPVDIEYIAPDEFDQAGYDTMELYYLTRDGMLVDGDGDTVDNINLLIGPDALDQFGENGESDSVYVRNNTEELDIAIYMRDETLASFTE